MKLTFTSQDGSLKVEAEPKTMKDAFEAIGQVNEFLIAEPCGVCKKTGTYPRARKTKDYVFYEWFCPNCTATFMIHQSKEGGRLFTKRTDKDGKELPNNGWSVYNPSRAAPSNNNAFGQEPAREPQSYSQEEEVPF